MGEPDFYFCKVDCTKKQFDEGDHYETIKEQAEEEGYGDCGLAYDENDPPGEALMGLFDWDTASIIVNIHQRTLED
jgi:hypothetical protein